MEGMSGCCSCKCPHHKVPAVLWIIFGLVFLLGALGSLAWSTINIVWPILVILFGFMKLMGSSCKCCSGCEIKK
jgi:hypothetical protein